MKTWTLDDIVRQFPEAHIEEVGERRELVIYTGMATAVYDPENDTWTDTPDRALVPMEPSLD